MVTNPTTEMCEHGILNCVYCNDTLDKLITKWKKAIEQLRDDQMFAYTGAETEKLGHRIDVYTRCINDLEAGRDGRS